jgi:DNA-binding CsgD family transcriptional regulator
LVARRLFFPLIAIARAEGIPRELVAPPLSGLPRTSLRTLLESAGRLELALGDEAALMVAASRPEVWPETSLVARHQPSPEALCRVVWSSWLPSELPGFAARFERRGARGFEARASFDPALPVRPGLGAVLAGYVSALPAFFGLPRAHVVCGGHAGELLIEGEFAKAGAEAGLCDRAEVPGSTLATVRGLLDERALEKVRRLDISGATRALGEGLARARDAQSSATVVVEVLASYLRFSYVRVWADGSEPSASARALLGAAGERASASRLIVLGAQGERIGLLEVDEHGDLDLLEALLPWITAALTPPPASQLAEDEPISGPVTLTPRQRRIVELLASGLGNKEIAQVLGCAEATVEDHLTAVYRKLGVRGRTSLVAKLRAQGAA